MLELANNVLELTGSRSYFGRRHDTPALDGFHQQVRRTWLRCLRRQPEKPAHGLGQSSRS
jgi:hypothetical protein